MFKRPRRLRSSQWIRDMVAENTLTPADLIWPVFVIEGQNETQNIASLPGVHRKTADRLVEDIKRARDLGIPAIALFPVTPDHKKTSDGKEALNTKNLICETLHFIKKTVPDIGIITDVALDPYTTHGHDGLLKGHEILNDETVEILCKQAVVQAQAGSDIIAPSDMMDGRIGAIRAALDKKGFTATPILSYAAKYASNFYGPFRDAVKSGERLIGDKKTYQMDCRNNDEALREIAIDIEQGADMIMVKPGLPYLDVVARAKDNFNVPLFAYHTSGEYAMLKAASHNNWLDYDGTLLETLISFKRAGCSGILTYAALEAAQNLKKP